MKKQTKIIVIIALVLSLVAFLFWAWCREEAMKCRNETAPYVDKPPNNPSTLPATMVGSAPLDPMQAIIQTPIVFYGIVLDQNGEAVASAKVSASVLNNMMKGTPFSTVSDASGKFTIQSQGMSLHIEVSKPGYDRITRGGKLEPSSQGFDYGADVGRGIHRSVSASPVVFRLRKPENPVSLDRLVANPKVPRDGSPIAVNPSKTGKIALHIRCRTMEDISQAPNAPYDWRCEVAIEGGGIQEMNEEHSFIAPEGGYAESTVIDMPKTLDANKWSSRAMKNYWLRFPDNTYGRISFKMVARGDHFAEIEGFRNPTRNDRNLEPKLEGR